MQLEDLIVEFDGRIGAGGSPDRLIGFRLAQFMHVRETGIRNFNSRKIKRQQPESSAWPRTAAYVDKIFISVDNGAHL
jgi:hypothetical protein